MTMPSRSMLAGLIVLAAGGALAQEPAPDAAQDSASEPSHFQIVGLAHDDLLNLRATASAGGMLIGRLPNGAVVANLGCADVNGNRWCKVVDMDNDKVQGWAAARYLQPAGMEGEAAPQDAEPDVAQ